MKVFEDVATDTGGRVINTEPMGNLRDESVQAGRRTQESIRARVRFSRRQAGQMAESEIEHQGSFRTAETDVAIQTALLRLQVAPTAEME